jgi:hypothetical protein
MNARLDTDPELLDLVRRADPMRDPRVQANAGLDTESALRLIAPELDRPPVPRAARRRRRPALRIAVLVVTVAAAVLVGVNVASTRGGSAVSPAQAQARAILRHVRAALVCRLERSTRRRTWARSRRATVRPARLSITSG